MFWASGLQSSGVSRRGYSSGIRPASQARPGGHHPPQASPLLWAARNAPWSTPVCPPETILIRIRTSLRLWFGQELSYITEIYPVSSSVIGFRLNARSHRASLLALDRPGWARVAPAAARTDVSGRVMFGNILGRQPRGFKCGRSAPNQVSTRFRQCATSQPVTAILDRVGFSRKSNAKRTEFGGANRQD